MSYYYIEYRCNDGRTWTDDPLNRNYYPYELAKRIALMRLREFHWLKSFNILKKVI